MEIHFVLELPWYLDWLVGLAAWTVFAKLAFGGKRA
jgi:hypothetical protein